MKNALLPVITVTGMNFGGLIGGAVVTESLYALPGLGNLLVNSIYRKDVPMVLGATIFLAASYSIIMLIVDLLYAFVDPRIKSKYAVKKRKKKLSAAAEGGAAG